jgi:hypothetical protein
MLVIPPSPGIVVSNRLRRKEPPHCFSKSIAFKLVELSQKPNPRSQTSVVSSVTIGYPFGLHSRQIKRNEKYPPATEIVFVLTDLSDKKVVTALYCIGLYFVILAIMTTVVKLFFSSFSLFHAGAKV